MEEQKIVNIVVGITFIILALMFQPVQAFDDGRNDAMCAAIFITAQAQAEYNYQQAADIGDINEGLVQDLHRKYYKTRVSLLKWNLDQNADSYDLTVFGNFADRYTDELDTATALLHLDRCEHRIIEIWKEYQISRASGN